LIFKGGISITRPPWPFFDVSGSAIIFGDQVTVSSGVYILTHDHQFEKRNWKELDHVVNFEPTIIEDGVFLGINVIVLPSCKRIGKYSVVGAGAIVTKDIPDNEIWVGNPARKIGNVS
jgi:maltose O-acetyltransferase